MPPARGVVQTPSDPSVPTLSASRSADVRRVILLVEDDADVRRAVREAVADARDVWIEAESGRDALTKATAHRPDLVVLDLGLPDMDGRAVCAQLRRWSRAPIIVVSARHDEAEKVALLDAGADDYVTKPFGPAELRARVAAQLRRVARAAMASARVVVGELVIDLETRTVSRGGSALRLTPTEWALLAALAAQPGRTVTHRQLFAAVWGDGTFGDAQKYLRVYVTHLRKKVERVAHAPRYIITDPGVGYRLEGSDA